MEFDFFKAKFKEQLISWRRNFHMYPEISGQEKETAEFIAEELKEMGLEVQERVAGYGIVAILPGDPKKKCVAIRADMDALPIEEKNECSYKSKRPGKMHACGHDAHMAMVLGAVKYLVQNPPEGTIKFFFQPKEEKPPGGAKYMVEAGVMENPKVDAVFATHVTNSYPVGTIAICEGATMAVADDFKLAIIGKGGHGAFPHKTIDTIAVTAQVIEALQSITSRRMDPTDPVVLTIGTIHGGTAQNVIPDRVDMTGTLRCLSNEVRDQMLEYMHKTVEGVTSSWGARYKLDYLYGYPPVVNDPELLKVVEEITESLPDAVIHKMEKPLMSGEDVSYFGLKTPLAFFFTGAGNEDKRQAWHNCRFDIDEGALSYGAGVLALAAAKVAGEDKES